MTNPRLPANEDALAPRFTSAMNAATSPFGVLCDIPITFVGVALLGTIVAGVYSANSGLPLWPAAIVVGLPVIVSLVTHLALRNARNHVLQWVRTVPFPLENVNAVLCGSGEYFEIFMGDDMPSREVVMGFLERSSDEAFVLEQDESRRVISARFGVDDSKYNPYGSAYRRYVRLRAVVDRALVPMHDKHPIERVLIV